MHPDQSRPAHNPIIIHVADIEMAKQCAAEWPVVAGRLARASAGAADARGAAFESDSDLCRGWPVGVLAEPPFIQAVFASAVFRGCAQREPINRVSPTNAEHVRKFWATESS
jgi:hypothetical protein